MFRIGSNCNRCSRLIYHVNKSTFPQQPPILRSTLSFIPWVWSLPTPSWRGTSDLTIPQTEASGDLPDKPSSCLFGAACHYPECSRAIPRLRGGGPDCDICGAGPTVHRQPMFGMHRSYCARCWQERCEQENHRKEETLVRETEAKRRVDNMLELVIGTETFDRVPLKYCVDKAMEQCKQTRSRRWMRQELIYSLSMELETLQPGNRYVRSKQRVDAMDFQLWYACIKPASIGE